MTRICKVDWLHINGDPKPCVLPEGHEGPHQWIAQQFQKLYSSAEQAEAVALAVAGAYLDAAGECKQRAECFKQEALSGDSLQLYVRESEARYIAERIAGRTPANAKAALDKLVEDYLDAAHAMINDRDAIIERLQAECSRWKKAIEGLTPLGSEFVNDPEFCAEYIRKKTNYPKIIIDLRADVERMQAELAAAQKELRSWKSEFNMWRSAWLREIGGVIRNKSHEIDGFVLRTRDLYEKANRFDKMDGDLVGKTVIDAAKGGSHE